MKKLLFIPLAIAMVAVQACNANASEKNTEANDNAAVAEASSIEKEGATIQLTKADFLTKVMDYTKNEEWVYEGDKPALIDFYADWCGPCKITSPILEELAKEYEGKIYIYKINVDEEQELAQVFGVRGIPSFLYVPMEGQPQMSSGIARSEEETKEMFRKTINDILLQ